jgi:RNA polymerase sigma-70 factor (ECF subfamily)
MTRGQSYGLPLNLVQGFSSNRDRGSYFGEVDLRSSFQPFTVFSEQFGFVPKLFCAQTLVPRVIEAEAALISSILFTDHALARAQKECILLALAAANDNPYCSSLHYQTLKLLGATEQRLDRIVADYQQADLAPTNTAVLKLTLKLGTSEDSFSRQDVCEARSRGLTDECLLEAILTAALSRLLCVLSTGVGAVSDFASREVPPAVYALSVCSDVSPTAGEKLGLYLDAPELKPGDFAPFAFLRDQFGSVPNVFRAQTLRPDVLEAEACAIRSVLVPEDALTRARKERILLGGSQAKLVESDRALLSLAEKLAAEAPEFSRSDIQALQENGFNEEQILETVVTTSLACFFNLLQVGLGVAPDFPAPWTGEQKTGPKKAHLSSSGQRHTHVTLPVDPDAESVARVQGGDLDSFEELMNRHSQRVYRTLVGILGNPDEARDAMQDTFLKAFQHLAGFEGRSKFSTWLVSITANTGIQRLRERRPMESLDETFDEQLRPRQVQAWTDDPERLYSRAEMRSLVENGVMRLPAKYRLVLILLELEQLPLEEAAAALGLGIPAIKARRLRGRLKLREALAPHFIRPERNESRRK